MTISNEKPDVNKLVYQVNGEEVIFFTVSLNEDAIKRIIIDITTEYGQIKMRHKYDEHYPEGKGVKGVIRKGIIGIPQSTEIVEVRIAFEEELEKNHPELAGAIRAKYEKMVETINRKYIGKQKDVDAEFDKFFEEHKDELVELVVTETLAKKEATHPTGSVILLEDGITYDYTRTELEPIEITSNTVDPNAPVKRNMEVANTSYRILEYPLLARMLMNLLNNPTNIRGLDETINAVRHGSIEGLRYIESIINNICLEPYYTDLKSNFFDIIMELSNNDPSACRELPSREISSNSKLFDKFKGVEEPKSKKIIGRAI